MDKQTIELPWDGMRDEARWRLSEAQREEVRQIVREELSRLGLGQAGRAGGEQRDVGAASADDGDGGQAGGR